MARRKRKGSSDPRSAHGKYSSDSAPSKNSSSTTVASGAARPVPASDRSGMKETNEKPEEPTMEKSVPNARGANDPEWYTKDTQLVIDTASLPFSDPLGEPLKLQTPGDIYATDGVSPEVVAATSPLSEAVPGICTLVTKSTFGTNRYAQDPANVAMNALYTHVRYVNSGRKNYDAVDLFMYVSSMADVYSYLMWMQRAYAKGFLYSQKNKYVGEALLLSEYIDPRDIKQNLANFRYWINSFINKIASFAVPASISYFQRRAWIYSHIYLENPDMNIKDQLYQFSPDGFYRFELDSHGAGMLKYSLLSDIIGHVIDDTHLITVAELESIGDWLLANITGDEDFGLMSGDILKAFNGEIIGISSLPEVVDIVPVYSEYVLLQMKNANVIPTSRGNHTPVHYDDTGSGEQCYAGNMYQNTDGNLWSIEGVAADIYAIGGKHEPPIMVGVNKVLTLKTPTPTPIDVMEISRMTLGGYGVLAQTNMDPIIKVSCGADIIESAHVTVYEPNSSGIMAISNVPLPNDCSAIADTIMSGTPLRRLLQYNKFKYAPMCYVFNLTVNMPNNPDVIDDVRIISDIDNYTVVDWRIIQRLHEVALLSMLWVPGVAKMVNFSSSAS